MSSSRFRKKENCCYRRTALEKILIFLSAIISVLIVLFLIVLLVPPNSVKVFPCNTTVCIQQTAQLIQTIDPRVDPCRNFYQFSCGRLLENSHGDESLGPFFLAKESAKRSVYELYNESIHKTDHKVVKSAKNFFRACSNPPPDDGNSLRVIGEMLETVGGWPVVEDNFWNETAFDWIKIVCKLRKLGYHYASFLEVTVESDPNNGNKHILQVALPITRLLDGYPTIQDKINILVETAVKFGAKRETALIEMTAMYDFVFDLQAMSSSHGNGVPHRRLTVAECQRKYKDINWLEFINSIVGPSVRVFRDDYILFPLTHTIHKWFSFLAKFPKRILANYMIWKAIEGTLPYVKSLSTIETEPKEDADFRSEFCVKEIRKRFHPSPIDVLYLRKYFPWEKLNEINTVIDNIKFELMKLLYQNTLINRKEKLIAMERIKQMGVIVGSPVNYFNDDILDDLDVDMAELKNDDLLSIMLQANRNYQSWTFSQVYSTNGESQDNEWSVQTLSQIGDYYYEENLLVLPITFLRGDVFDLKQPTYKKYALMGILMGHHFLYALERQTINFDEDDSSERSSKLFKNQAECFFNQTKHLNVTREQASNLLLYQSLGLRASYEAYKKLGGSEQIEILSFNYTIRQMFWISAASHFCQPSSIFSPEYEFFPFIVKGLVYNSDDFASDFNCPSTSSNINLRDKC